MKKLFFILTIVYSLVTYSNAIAKKENKMNPSDPKNNNYLIETGNKDRERLLTLNTIVNPYSTSFLKQYIKSGDKVLEIGCGIGVMSQEIAKIVGASGKVTGTDLNEDQLAIAKELVSDSHTTNLEFRKASVYNLSSIKDTYDIIYARFLFIHLEDASKAIEQIKLLLKPGGFLLIEELAGSDTIASSPNDVRLSYVKKVDELQESHQKTNFSISKSLGNLINQHGFVLYNDAIIQPKLDTYNKRRIFSLGMKSVENSLIEKGSFSKEEYQQLIKEVEDMEKDQKIDLYFYKIGQMAAKRNGD